MASRSPGTCRESLWLLPSGPDQVHDLAMRGDPPLIGARTTREPHYSRRAAPGAAAGAAHRAAIMPRRRCAVADRVPERMPRTFAQPRCARLAAPLLALVRALTSCRAAGAAAASRDSHELAGRHGPPGPARGSSGPHGAPLGFEHDLLARFAREQHSTLRVPSSTRIARRSDPRRSPRGEAHIGARRPLSPPPRRRGAARDACDADPQQVLWTHGIRGRAGADLQRRRLQAASRGATSTAPTVAYLHGTGIELQLATVRAAHPEIQLAAARPAVGRRADRAGRRRHVDYAVVPSTDAALARNIYLDFDVAFPAGPKRELAWAVAPQPARSCATQLDAFIAACARDGTLARLCRALFRAGAAGRAHRRRRVPRPHRDAAAAVLRKYFEDAQDETGIEWRLLAAIAYQESQWDPDATSETGVRGIMQITEDTARHARRRRSARCRRPASIAAARYLRDLQATSCRRASPSPTARGWRSRHSTSASAISRTRACWRRA